LEGQSKAYPTARRALIADPTADDREDSPELPGDTHFTAEVPLTLDAFALGGGHPSNLGGTVFSRISSYLRRIADPTAENREDSPIPTRRDLLYRRTTADA
jgi:hypothetical protein